MTDFAVTVRCRASFIISAQNREEAERRVQEAIAGSLKLVAPGREHLRQIEAEDFRAVNISVL